MSKKILIIDDQLGIRESLKLILGDIYVLILTEGAEDGFKILENSTDDIGLVLLDIKMPQINGLDALVDIKEKHPDIPVVMVTGYNFVETANEATQRGANGYIVKPFKSEDVLKVVEKYMNK